MSVALHSVSRPQVPSGPYSSSDFRVLCPVSPTPPLIRLPGVLLPMLELVAVQGDDMVQRLVLQDLVSLLRPRTESCALWLGQKTWQFCLLQLLGTTSDTDVWKLTINIFVAVLYHALVMLPQVWPLRFCGCPLPRGSVQTCMPTWPAPRTRIREGWLTATLHCGRWPGPLLSEGTLRRLSDTKNNVPVPPVNQFLQQRCCTRSVLRMRHPNCSSASRTVWLT